MNTITKTSLIGLIMTTLAFGLILPAQLAQAAIFEPGFEKEQVTDGLVLGVAMAHAPDGRIFIAEKSGTVKVVKNDALLSTPVITLTDVNTFGDRGLIGIALDPDFATNGYMYLSYTYENSPGLNFGGEKTGRVVRVTVIGDTASEASKVVLLGTEGGSPSLPSCENYPVTADCIPSDSSSHSVGDLAFGPDGKLYASLGDGASFDFIDPRALRAQNLDSLAGKVVRINTDGTAPSDNPYYDGDPNSNRSKVYSFGHRNQYRLTFHPVTGQLFGGDVGWSDWEEVNRLLPGANYGWPCWEGNATTTYNCTASGMTMGTYVYAHNAAGAGSIAVGDFPANSAYPASYDNTMFIGDYAQNWIKLLELDANGNITDVRDFMDDPMGPVDLVTGIDGNVYYISIYTGELMRITHTSGNRKPVVEIDATPTSGLAPLAVTFSSAGSYEPDGDNFTYFWDFKDGATSSDANPSHTYTVNGSYDATLTITDEFGASAAKSITITVGNQAPTASIDLPASGSLYQIDTMVPFAGSATDPEDGTLGSAAFDWDIILHHNTHTHVLQQFSGTTSAEFFAPDHSSTDVYIEIILTVTDSAGLTDTDNVFMYLDSGAGAGNLIINPSVETPGDGAQSNMPLSWLNGWYGVLDVTFTYPVPGFEGDDAIKVEVSNYGGTGNAKWFFSPVFVTPGEDYLFSNQYTATLPTIQVAEFGFPNGTKSYELIAELDATSTPTFVENTITIPAGVETMTVFHEVYGNGELVTDDYSLTLVQGSSTPDTTPPTVSITNPADGSTASGTISVSADATDNVAVDHVHFFIDGTEFGSDMTAPYDFLLDTTLYTNATYTLEAVAHDSSGNVATSAPVAITVDNATSTPDTEAPTVTFTNLVGGETLSGNFVVTADATDNTGVTSVGLIIDGVHIFHDYAAPYELPWDTTSYADGTHTVQVHADDGAGNRGTTTVLTVTVDNSTSTITNLISNGDLEIENGSEPLDWFANTWGNHTATFTYPVVSHDGSNAARLDITDYPFPSGSGDSKWIHQTVPVTPGTEYTYSDYYRSDTISDLIGQYTLSGGGYHYFGPAKEIQPTATWQTVTATFTPPVDATHVTIFHLISAEGFLEIDDAMLYVSGTSTPSETNPPVVEFLNPLDGQTVSGTVNVTASSSDDTAVTYIFYAVDGAPQTGNITEAPYAWSWDTTQWPDGEHFLKATTHDPFGNNTAETITVTIDNSSPPASNMILNPSLENGSSTPDNWTTLAYGTNDAAFTYPVTGSEGADAGRIDITSHTDGAAMWRHDAVTVSAGQVYTFSHAYRSDIDTVLGIEYIMSDTSVVNTGLANVFANTSWTNQTFTIVPPTDAVSMTILHSMSDEGFLEIDDYSLATGTPDAFDNGKISFTFDDGWYSQYSNAAPILNAGGIDSTFYIVSDFTANAGESELVVNGGLETVASSTGDPYGWHRGGWGNNTRTYEYPVASPYGTNAAKVAITDYTDGDTKWFYDDVTVSPDTDYTISGYYNSNIASQVLIRYTLDDTSVQYVYVNDYASTGGVWDRWEHTFTTPTNAVSMTVFHVIYGVGELTIDNLSLHDVQTYVTIEDVLAMQDDGHEIASHTITHPDLTTLSTPAATTEIEDSKSDLLGFGFTGVETLAYPLGAYNPSIQSITDTAGYLGGRSIERGYNTKGTDKFALRVQQIDRTTTLADVQGWTADAEANDLWLILMFHQVDDNLAATLGVDPALFQQIVDHVNAITLDTITVSEGIGLMN